MCAIPVAQGAPTAPSGSVREWTDEIIYVIVIQKFCNGNSTNDVMLGRYGNERQKYEGGLWGGDLEGIIGKLEYLSNLGVTALLLYPVMANDTKPFGKYLAPGYRPRDYFRVDENFGDIKTLRRLVDAAHKRNIRVVLDMPLGMPGVEHPFLSDPEKSSWFGPPTVYGLPQWKTDNPAVADYLIRVARFWQDQSGCDGFRLDSAHFHPEAFWRRFAAETKAPFAGRFFLLAEVPLNPVRIGEFLKNTGFDSAYDFSFGAVRDVVGCDTNRNMMAFVFDEARRNYPVPAMLCAQIDAYEDPCFVTAAREPKKARTRQALAMLLTVDRIPLLYSGDEIGLAYDRTGALFDQANADPAFLAFVKSLIALRKSEVVLRRGSFKLLPVKAPLFAYLRTVGQDVVMAVFNLSDKAVEVDGLATGKARRTCGFRDLLAGQVLKEPGGDGAIRLEPRGFRIMKLFLDKQ